MTKNEVREVLLRFHDNCQSCLHSAPYHHHSVVHYGPCNHKDRYVKAASDRCCFNVYALGNCGRIEHDDRFGSTPGMGEWGTAINIAKTTDLCPLYERRGKS